MRTTVAKMLSGVQHKGHKLIANNTVEYVNEKNDRVIRLHRTDILTFTAEGVILNTGGWRTATTKARMSEHIRKLGWTLFSNRGVWTVGYWKDDVHEYYVFCDGMRLNHLSHDVTYLDEKPEPVTMQIKFNERVKKFVKDYVDALFAGKIEPSSGGDCWMCLLKDAQTGAEWGGKDHLLAHIKERYYVPSLIWNALRHSGVSSSGLSGPRRLHEQIVYMCQNGKSVDAYRFIAMHKQMSNMLYKYMKHHLDIV